MTTFLGYIHQKDRFGKISTVLGESDPLVPQQIAISLILRKI